MESYFSGRFQVVFVMFLMLLSVSLAIEQKETNDICKEKDKPGFQLNLTGAMIFSDHIFMMDNKSQVYKVPKSNYDGAYGKMVLNIKGIPIEKYWPPFKGNILWECVKKQYMTIFHLINGHTGDVFINFLIHDNVCENDKNEDSALCFNLKTQEFCPLKTLKVLENEQFFVDTGLKIFSIKPYQVTEEKQKDKLYPLLVTWKFKYGPDNLTINEGTPSYACMMFYLIEEKNHDNRSIAVYRVRDFNSGSTVAPNGFFLENITDWNISEDFLPVGYLFNGSFYLYALDKLIIFKDKMPSYDEQYDSNNTYPIGSLMAVSKISVIKLSEYFQCDSDNQSTVTVPPDVHGNKTASSTTASGTMLIIIIASLVLLLILIGAAILIYCLAGGKKGGEKKSKEKDSKHKKLSGKSEKPSVASSSVAGSKVSSKVSGKGGSKMGNKQSSIAGGQSKAASSTAASAVSSSKVPSKVGKKNK